MDYNFRQRYVMRRRTIWRLHMESAIIRDTIIKNLKKEKNFNNMVVVEINGILSAAADIALSVGKNECQIFRIAVIPHKTQRRSN